jgi:hypothetical protein
MAAVPFRPFKTKRSLSGLTFYSDNAVFNAHLQFGVLAGVGGRAFICAAILTGLLVRKTNSISLNPGRHIDFNGPLLITYAIN